MDTNIDNKIMEKLNQLQVCREHETEEGAANMYDETLRSIELLFNIRSGANEIYLPLRDNLCNALEIEMINIEEKSNKYSSNLSKFRNKNKLIVELKWEFRELLEDEIIKVIKQLGIGTDAK